MTKQEAIASLGVQKSEFSFKGRKHQVPMCRIEGREVISVGRWLAIAAIRDEEWADSGAVHEDPRAFIDAVKASGLPADILTFSGPLEAGAGNPNYPSETDNAAVIRTDKFKEWWESLPQEARKNTKRAARRGVEVRVVTLDANLASGIKAIYDETPIRQGRKFWHYGKAVEQVFQENSTYAERSQFLGAYHGDELIAFVKLVRVGDTARIMQILGKSSHQDKRPTIALVAKAAELCHSQGLKYLIYGKFSYGNKNDSMMEFKKRLGFEQIDFPKYYIALTRRGGIAMKLGLHRDLQSILPRRVLDIILHARSRWLSWRMPAGRSPVIEAK